MGSTWHLKECTVASGALQWYESYKNLGKIEFTSSSEGSITSSNGIVHSFEWTASEEELFIDIDGVYSEDELNPIVSLNNLGEDPYYSFYGYNSKSFRYSHNSSYVYLKSYYPGYTQDIPDITFYLYKEQ